MFRRPDARRESIGNPDIGFVAPQRRQVFIAGDCSVCGTSAGGGSTSPPREISGGSPVPFRRVAISASTSSTVRRWSSSSTSWRTRSSSSGRRFLTADGDDLRELHGSHDAARDVGTDDPYRVDRPGARVAWVWCFYVCFRLDCVSIPGGGPGTTPGPHRYAIPRPLQRGQPHG